MSRVLLVAPSYMNLYEDIVSGLQSKGYEVQYYPDKRIKGDPFNKVGGGERKMPVDDFMSLLDSMWSEIMKKDPYKCFYDYLLVIDGLSIPPSLFDKLRKTNPNIVTCNYLYDRVKGVYELDRNFPYYDRLYSFDRKDCIDYNLFFLPIYWTAIERCNEIRYDIFGFGGYDDIRLNVFKRVKSIATREKMSFLIQIFCRYNNLLTLTVKNLVKSCLGHKHLALYDILSGLYTNKTLSPTLFRKMIASSSIILDTNHSYQDGLTARFMWALGAEKKIITTNASVKNYPFYSKEQFFIIENNWEELPAFLKSAFEMSNTVKTEVLKYRIDNWIDTILGTTN